VHICGQFLYALGKTFRVRLYVTVRVTLAMPAIIDDDVLITGILHGSADTDCVERDALIVIAGPLEIGPRQVLAGHPLRRTIRAHFYSAFYGDSGIYRELYCGKAIFRLYTLGPHRKCPTFSSIRTMSMRTGNPAEARHQIRALIGSMLWLVT
jgi:hypothetical protein